MPAVLSVVWKFIKPHWKQVAVVFVMFLMLWYVHHRGYVHAKLECRLEAQKLEQEYRDKLEAQKNDAQHKLGIALEQQAAATSIKLEALEKAKLDKAPLIKYVVTKVPSSDATYSCPDFSDDFDRVWNAASEAGSYDKSVP